MAHNAEETIYLSGKRVDSYCEDYSIHQATAELFTD